MRRFRNPRFAPESLERKLSPSGIAHVPVPVVAEVHIPTVQVGTATHSTATVVSTATHSTTTIVGTTTKVISVVNTASKLIAIHTPDGDDDDDSGDDGSGGDGSSGGTDPNGGNGDPPVDTPVVQSGSNQPS